MKQKVNVQELDLDDQAHIVTLRGQPFTGVAAERMAAQDRYVEQTFLGGVAHGICQTWTLAGVLLEDITYVYGSKHGNYKRWSTDGYLMEEGHYVRGMLIAKQEYDRCGQLLSQFEIAPGSPEEATVAVLRHVVIPEAYR